MSLHIQRAGRVVATLARPQPKSKERAMTQAENRNTTNLSSRTVAARLSVRRDFIGGSDARIIMGQDEKALMRLWQEKRGEVGPEDLSTNLIVQLGLVTEDLNR